MITLAAIIASKLESDPDLTQAKLADAAQLSQPRLNDLLQGNGLPRRRGIPPLAAALGYDADELVRIVDAERKRRSKAGKAKAQQGSRGRAHAADRSEGART